MTFRTRSWTRRAPLLAAAALALPLVTLGPSVASGGGVDTTPPRLLSIGAAPAAVDVSASAVDVTVKATITDDASGLDDCCPSVQFRSPSGATTAFVSLERTVGDEFGGTLRLAAGSESGRWRLDSFFARDRAGNFRSISGNTLVALGLGADVLVGDATAAGGGPDVAPPLLTGLTVSPTAVDVRDAPASVTLTATITDASGVADCCPATFQFRSAAGTQTLFGFFQRVGGDAFAATVRFPQGAEPGRWRLDNLSLNDRAGNFLSLGRYDLADLGLDLPVDVSVPQAPPPNAAPVVDAGADENGAEGAPVQVDATFADADSAAHTATIDWGDGARSDGVVAGSHVSGTHVYADDGRYAVTVTVTDDAGASGSDDLLAAIRNVAPTASIGGPYAGTPLTPVALSATASDPGAADALTYEWDFDDDGTFGADAAGAGLPSASHQYAFPGTYTAALRVRDDDAGVSDVSTTTVAIAAPPSTDGLVAGSARWARGIETQLALHAHAGRISGVARFRGDGRDITVSALDALAVSGSSVVVFGTVGGEAVRIDASDGGPTHADTFRLRLERGYDSGVLTRTSGNLVVGTGG